jgi:trigger factor
MELQIEDLSAVRKRVHIEIPARRVDSTFASVVNTYAQRASLPGFRRGKVPTSHVRKLYGRQIDLDVAQRLVEYGWKCLLDDETFVPLGEPELDTQPVKAGHDYSFTMIFDVAPEIALQDHSEFKVDQVKWTASDEVVAHELTHLAEHVSSYEMTDDRDLCENGDMVVIDYAGSVDDVAFEGGTAQDAELILGSERFIPGFEEQIVGQKVGADFDVKVCFPDAYPAEHLQGKDAVFKCTLKGIKAKVIPEVGPILAERLGEESFDVLKEKVKEGLEERHNQQSKGEARTALRDVIGSSYDFELPEKLVTAAIEDRRNQLRTELTQSGTEESELEAKIDESMATAEETTVAGLRAEFVLDELAKQNEIDVTHQELTVHIEEIAQTTGPYAAQIKQMYRDPNRRAGLARRMRHDKVLDFLLPQVNVTTETREIPVHDHCDLGHDDDNDNEE